MLELQNVYRSFRTIPAIENVSFKLGAGKIGGFWGRTGQEIDNGQDCTGLLGPNAGQVLFEGGVFGKDGGVPGFLRLCP